MHTSFILALAALAAATPVPSGSPTGMGNSLPIAELPEVTEILADIEGGLPRTRRSLRRGSGLPADYELPEVTDLLPEIEALVGGSGKVLGRRLDLPTGTGLPDVEGLLSQVESLVAGLPISSDVLSEIQGLLSKVEGLLSGSDGITDIIPSVSELLSEIESLLPTTEELPTQDLPSVQDLLLEIDSLLPTLPSLDGLDTATKILRKRGLITEVEGEGVDVLDSQNVVPLHDTLSEFDTSKSDASPSKSAWPSSTVWPASATWPSSTAWPSSGGSPPGTKYLATFDDLIPAVGEITVQEVGPYDGLEYNGIDLVTLGVAGTIVTGIIPESPPNAGAYGLTTDLVDGLPNITTNYVGSVTSTFNFQSFWFGCVKGTVETIASEPLSCNVTVTGYKGWKQTHNETFIFTYNTLVDGETKNMTEANLGWDFVDVDTVTFDTSYDVSNLIGATLIDSLSYTVFDKLADVASPWQ